MWRAYSDFYNNDNKTRTTIKHEPYIQVSYLTAFAVDGKRMINRSLNTKPIQCCSKHTIIIKPIAELLMHGSFIRYHSINNALVKVRGPNPPRLACEGDVVGVMHLAQMVEGASLLGIGQSIGPSIVSDCDEPLLNVYVWSAVLPHGSELHEMAILTELFDGEEHVERAYHIVMLSEHGPRPINHGVGSRPLFTKVDDSIWLEGLEGIGEELKVGYISDEELDVFASERLPSPDAIVDGRDGGEGVKT